MTRNPAPRRSKRACLRSIMGRPIGKSAFLFSVLALWTTGLSLDQYGATVSAFCPAYPSSPLPGRAATKRFRYVTPPRKESKQIQQQHYMTSMAVAEAAATTIENTVQPTSGVFGIVNILLHEPVVWSTLVMLSIVSLLLAWEAAIKTVRKVLPEALMPVVDSMLAEMGGLGFIGVRKRITCVRTDHANTTFELAHDAPNSLLFY